MKADDPTFINALAALEDDYQQIRTFEDTLLRALESIDDRPQNQSDSEDQAELKTAFKHYRAAHHKLRKTFIAIALHEYYRVSSSE